MLVSLRMLYHIFRCTKYTDNSRNATYVYIYILHLLFDYPIDIVNFFQIGRIMEARLLLLVAGAILFRASYSTGHQEGNSTGRQLGLPLLSGLTTQRPVENSVADKVVQALGATAKATTGPLQDLLRPFLPRPLGGPKLEPSSPAASSQSQIPQPAPTTDGPIESIGKNIDKALGGTAKVFRCAS